MDPRMDQWKGCPHHSFLGWYLGPPLDDAFSSSKPHRFSLCRVPSLSQRGRFNKIHLLSLEVTVTWVSLLQLPPFCLCRIAVSTFAEF